MTEVKTQLEEIEKIVEERSKLKAKEYIGISKFDFELHKVKVNKDVIIKRLEEVKKQIKDRHDEALKVWDKAVEVYSEFMKKQMGSNSLKFPQKPKMPDAYEEINGYIDLFSSLVDNEIYLDMEYLENIFLNSKQSINKQKSEYYNLCSFTSGSTLAMADWSLTTSK